MVDDERHIVDFELYCKDCKYRNKKETEIPCFDCLEEPVRFGTNVPEYFELNSVIKGGKKNG